MPSHAELLIKELLAPAQRDGVPLDGDCIAFVERVKAEFTVPLSGLRCQFLSVWAAAMELPTTKADSKRLDKLFSLCYGDSKSDDTIFAMLSVLGNAELADAEFMTDRLERFLADELSWNPDATEFLNLCLLFDRVVAILARFPLENTAKFQPRPDHIESIRRIIDGSPTKLTYMTASVLQRLIDSDPTWLERTKPDFYPHFRHYRIVMLSRVGAALIQQHLCLVERLVESTSRWKLRAQSGNIIRCLASASLERAIDTLRKLALTCNNNLKCLVPIYRADMSMDDPFFAPLTQGSRIHWPYPLCFPSLVWMAKN